MKTYTTQIIDAIEYLANEEPYIVNSPWPKKFIFIMVFELKYGDIKNTERDYKKIENEKSIYAASILTQSDVTRTKKILGKEMK